MSLFVAPDFNRLVLNEKKSSPAHFLPFSALERWSLPDLSSLNTYLRRHVMLVTQRTHDLPSTAWRGTVSAGGISCTFIRTDTLICGSVGFSLLVSGYQVSMQSVFFFVVVIVERGNISSTLQKSCTLSWNHWLLKSLRHNIYKHVSEWSEGWRGRLVMSLSFCLRLSAIKYCVASYVAVIWLRAHLSSHTYSSS